MRMLTKIILFAVVVISFIFLNNFEFLQFKKLRNPYTLGSNNPSTLGITFLRKTRPTVAIVTAYSKSSQTEPFGWNEYGDILPVTLSNWKKYASYQGYHLFVNNENFMNKSRKASWAKIPVLKNYLKHYDWVLWTDVDFLFTDIMKPLPLDPTKNMILSYECLESKNLKLMTGTMLFKSSPWSFRFLDLWDKQYEQFQNSKNHDQVAFEFLTANRDSDNIKILTPSQFITYDSRRCFDPQFGLHFPANHKKYRIVNFLAKHNVDVAAAIPSIYQDRDIILRALDSIAAQTTIPHSVIVFMSGVPAHEHARLEKKYISRLLGHTFNISYSAF